MAPQDAGENSGDTAIMIVWYILDSYTQKALAKYQKKHYGQEVQVPDRPLPELEDLQTIARLMSQVPELSEYLKG